RSPRGRGAGPRAARGGTGVRDLARTALRSGPARRGASRRPRCPRVKSYAIRRDAVGLRVAIVVSRFNHLITVRLLDGCVAELVDRGAAHDDLHVAWVPGAFEIPQAARTLAASGRYDAVVTLGVVIRGGTPHFEYVCRAVTDGVREIMRD